MEFNSQRIILVQQNLEEAVGVTCLDLAVI